MSILDKPELPASRPLAEERPQGSLPRLYVIVPRDEARWPWLEIQVGADVWFDRQDAESEMRKPGASIDERVVEYAPSWEARHEQALRMSAEADRSRVQEQLRQEQQAHNETKRWIDYMNVLAVREERDRVLADLEQEKKGHRETAACLEMEKQNHEATDRLLERTRARAVEQAAQIEQLKRELAEAKVLASYWEQSCQHEQANRLDDLGTLAKTHARELELEQQGSDLKASKASLGIELDQALQTIGELRNLFDRLARATSQYNDVMNEVLAIKA